MSDELVFYTHPMSRGRVSRWMLEEVGRPYRTEVVEYGTTMKAPAYLAINPMGKVPAIVHGNTVVTENAAICAYLADAFPEAKLAPPPGSPLRGPYYRWFFFAAGPLEMAAVHKALEVTPAKEKEGFVGYGTYGAVMDTLDGLLSKNPYVAGETFTAADLYLGSHLNWGMMFGTIEKRPSFERYVATLTSRPAAIRANEIDQELLAKYPVPGAPPPPRST